MTTWSKHGRRWGVMLLGVVFLTSTVGTQALTGTQDVEMQAPGVRAGLYRAGVSPVDGVGVSPGVPGVLLVVGGSGILYSLDNGATWQIPSRPDHQAPAVRPNPYGAVAAVAPRTESGGANVRFIVGNGNRIWRSGDYGTTWAVETLTNHPDCAAYPNDARVMDIRVNPRTPTQLIARMQCRVPPINGFISLPGNRPYVLVSNDRGLTWALTGWASFWNVVPSGTVAGRLFAHAGGVWQQSDDNGATWTPRTLPVSDLTTDAVNNALLYGRSNDGLALLISTDNGQTWGAPIRTPEVNGSPCSMSNLLGSPTATGVVFVQCASDNSWLRYTQSSGQWRPLPLASDAGPTRGASRSDLIIDYSAPGRVFVTHWTGLRQFDALGENAQLPEARFPAPLAAEWRIHLSSPWSWRNLSGADWTADGQVWASFPQSPPNTMVRWNGQAWSTSDPGDCASIDMLTPTLGFATCDGLRRWDGTNWVVDEASPVADRLSMVSSTVGMGAGYVLNTSEQGVYARNSGGWTLVRPVTDTLQSSVRYSILDIDMVAADFAWVIERGRILRWDGAQFTESPTGVNPAPFITAISALDRDNAWAVGRDGIALRWNGSTWQPYYNVSPYNENLRDVVMLSPTEAWALGDGSNVLHFVNGSWEYSAGPVMQADRLILPPAGEQWVLGDQPYERMNLIYLPLMRR